MGYYPEQKTVEIVKETTNYWLPILTITIPALCGVIVAWLKLKKDKDK